MSGPAPTFIWYLLAAFGGIVGAHFLAEAFNRRTSEIGEAL